MGVELFGADLTFPRLCDLAEGLGTVLQKLLLSARNHNRAYLELFGQDRRVTSPDRFDGHIGLKFD